MGVMSRFESMMENMVEGTFGRMFRSRIQDAELVTLLVRAMENRLQIGQDRKIAPTEYTVFLSRRDYDTVQKRARSLATMLQQSLINVARDRGYLLTMRPRIVFEEDPNLVTGQARVMAQIVDAGAGGGGGGNATGAAGEDDDTRTLQQGQPQAPVRPSPASSEPLPAAWLTLVRPQRGKPVQLTRSVIHIGRHQSNDFVVNDKRVSRYHAEIRFEHGQFMLYDLGSTNGVGINGVLTRQPVPLKNGDIVSVGSFEFVFQRR
ncbi:MAG TPA: DUF3662 and FHA domain-containing protein [Ktedonobacterales bacterium]